MEIARPSTRGDIIAYTKLARENNNILTPKILNKRFLFRTDKVALLITTHLVKLGLFEWDIEGKKAMLTDEGKEAAEKEVAFLHEKGVYSVICSNDPLLPHPVLLILPAPWKRLDILMEEQSGDGHEGGESIKTPDDIRSIVGRNYSFLRDDSRSALGSSQDEIRVIKVADSCFPVAMDIQYIMKGTISKDKPLSGEVRGNGYRIQFNKANITFDKAFQSLESVVSNIKKDHEGSVFFDVSFAEVENDIYKRNFSGDITKTDLTLNGPFGEKTLNITLSDIYLRPKNTIEANMWYRWLLEDGLDRYLSPSGFEEYAEEIKERFTRFGEESTQIGMIQPLELARDIEYRNDKARKKPRSKKYWYLMAPHDLRYGGPLNE